VKLRTFCFLLAVLPAQLVAQQPPSGNAATRFFRDVTLDQKRIWTSPFHMTQRQFWTLAVPLVGGTVGLKSLDNRIQRELPNTQDQYKWGGRISRLGSGYSLGMAVGATTLGGHYAGRPDVAQMGRDGAEALVSSLIVTYAMKAVTWRERPDGLHSRGSFYSGGDSFPSGHAMASFAVATAMASNRRCPKWLAVTMYGAATAISLSRVASNRHFASDIYFGAFTGVLIGKSISLASQRR
jgi:membrane-associated phospholipid phosphatase